MAVRRLIFSAADLIGRSSRWRQISAPRPHRLEERLAVTVLLVPVSLRGHRPGAGSDLLNGRARASIRRVCRDDACSENAELQQGKSALAVATARRLGQWTCCCPIVREQRLLAGGV